MTYLISFLAQEALVDQRMLPKRQDGATGQFSCHLTLLMATGEAQFQTAVAITIHGAQ